MPVCTTDRSQAVRRPGREERSIPTYRVPLMSTAMIADSNTLTAETSPTRVKAIQRTPLQSTMRLLREFFGC